MFLLTDIKQTRVYQKERPNYCYVSYQSDLGRWEAVVFKQLINFPLNN